MPLATLAAMAVATARALARPWRILPVGDHAVADRGERRGGGGDHLVDRDQRIAGVAGQGFDLRIVVLAAMSNAGVEHRREIGREA